MPTAELPTLTVVIPHYLGDVLSRAVASVRDHSPAGSVEVVVADDQPRDDGSISRARMELPSLRVVPVGGGRGFGAAVNAGLRAASCDLVFLLNNDAVVTAGWLEPLLRAAEAHPEAGAFQAKMLDLANPCRFDYSAAAGGLIDRFGYPFARGRLFDAIEEDHGQYDDEVEIFWAVGGGMLVRRSVVLGLGGFDEAFYMHMEEIDLCWRLHLAGWTVRSVPGSVVLHEGGHTLRAGSLKKTWLNHRNSLVLLVKNWAPSTLLLVFPVRCALEVVTIGYGILRRDWRHAAAAIMALGWLAIRWPSLLRRRAQAQSVRRVSDAAVMAQVFGGSVVYERFVRGRRIVTPPPPPAPSDRPSPRRPSCS